MLRVSPKPLIKLATPAEIAFPPQSQGLELPSSTMIAFGAQKQILDITQRTRHGTSQRHPAGPRARRSVTRAGAEFLGTRDAVSYRPAIAPMPHPLPAHLAWPPTAMNAPNASA
jgi:hypothetical protein